ncbi:MAG TPA: DUF2867 domain-containing protein [Actinomycetota bacterium]|nr:DUF2867 domain-containing protein [Actinomycetota bacterium]
MGIAGVEIGSAGPVVRRRAVATDEPLIGADRYDYADAFEVRVPRPDPRSAEQWARAALEQAPRTVRWVIRVAHRYVVRFRLGPSSSPNHVLGWSIVTSQHEAIVLEAVSPLLRAVIVARRIDPTVALATTYLFFTRPTAVRIVWAIVGPVHRRVAPYLLEHAAVLG